MADVSVFKNELAQQIFLVSGNIGAWPIDCLQAIGHGDGTISIRNKARAYSDSSVFFEIASENFASFIDESGSGYGSTEIEVVNNLNNLFVDAGPSAGVAPTITSATAVTVTDVETVNYLATATGGVGWEWGELPAGLAVSSHNPRNLIGTFADGAGTYDVDVTAVNYFGTDTETITFTVTATFADTRSVFMQNQDYLSASATTSNPFYRASNGSGSSDAWSISVWFKPGTLNQRQTIVSFGGNDANNEGRVSLSHNNASGDRIRLHYGSSNNYLRLQTPPNSITDGTWHHIFVTYDGNSTGVESDDIDDYYGRFEIWIDGVPQATSTSQSNYGFANAIVADNFFVGEASSGGAHIRGGYVNELALWASDESSNVADVYNGGTPHDLSLLTSSPNHWWRMGDGDTFPTIADNVGSLDFTMFNMSAANIVSDAP